MNQLPPSSRLRQENQVAVVTGGARGIGAGTVRRFVEEGARVVYSDLLNQKGKALEEELGKNAAFYPADATSPSDTEALMNFAVERFGRLWSLQSAELGSTPFVPAELRPGFGPLFFRNCRQT
jgi:NAD(P)-dependent dehydrogenase (short-subunit alcohol dehydrogenase family)